MCAAQSRQKSYANVRCRNLEFEIGDLVFLKVAPTKGVLRFKRKDKLSPRFLGPFEILERIGPVAYNLALPPSLSLKSTQCISHVDAKETHDALYPRNRLRAF